MFALWTFYMVVKANEESMLLTAQKYESEIEFK